MFVNMNTGCAKTADFARSSLGVGRYAIGEALQFQLAVAAEHRCLGCEFLAWLTLAPRGARPTSRAAAVC